MPFVFLGIAVFYLFIFNDFGLPVMTRVTACMFGRDRFYA
jgi:tight adherence protein C